MIQSMTGYGKATAELSDKKINVEIKSSIVKRWICQPASLPSTGKKK